MAILFCATIWSAVPLGIFRKVETNQAFKSILQPQQASDWSRVRADCNPASPPCQSIARQEFPHFFECPDGGPNSERQASVAPAVFRLYQCSITRRFPVSSTVLLRIFTRSSCRSAQINLYQWLIRIESDFWGNSWVPDRLPVSHLLLFHQSQRIDETLG